MYHCSTIITYYDGVRLNPFRHGVEVEDYRQIQFAPCNEGLDENSLYCPWCGTVTGKERLGSIIKRIQNSNKRKKWFQRNKQRMIDILDSKGYDAYFGQPGRGLWLDTEVGAQRILTVPEKQLSALKPYRGKRVRIVVVGSGRYKRLYMVGEFPEA